MTADWVPFHRNLAEGSKKGLPRGVRFVLLELSLKARPKGGVINLPAQWTTLKAVHDLIGGSRKEIDEALLEFTKPDEDGVAPIKIVKDLTRHTLIISKWREWAGGKSSTERVQKHRDAKKNATIDTDETVTSVTNRNGGNAYSTGQYRTVENKTEDPPLPPGGEDEEGAGIPEAESRSGETEPDEPLYDLTWRIWRSMYEQSRRKYGRYIDGGIREERFVQGLYRRASDLTGGDRVRVELLLRHWFSSFLRDDGELNCLARARHKLTLLEARLPTYGEPVPAKSVRRVRVAAVEEPPPLPSKERLDELRAIASGAVKGFKS